MKNQTVLVANIQKKLNDYVSQEMDYWDFSGAIRIIHKRV